jgi:hypothetical protein
MRFGLRTVFVIATVLIVAIGLTQARRRAILNEANALRADGANFAIDYRWWEKIWIQKPSGAGITVELRPNGDTAIKGKLLSRDEAIAKSQLLAKKLKEFGVEDIGFTVQRYRNGTPIVATIRNPDALKLTRP